MPLEEVDNLFEDVVEVHDRLPSQCVQQRLGILAGRRVKAFGEPVVDWCQEVMGFLAFALLLPEASEAGGGS